MDSWKRGVAWFGRVQHDECSANPKLGFELLCQQDCMIADAALRGSQLRNNLYQQSIGGGHISIRGVAGKQASVPVTLHNSRHEQPSLFQ